MIGLPDVEAGFYPVAAVAILLAGISKGGFGQGAGALAVPLMSMYVAPPVAAGIMLPILCAMDLFGVHAWRGRWSLPHLKSLLPGALFGIAVGALAFGMLPVNAIRLLLGGIAVAFGLNHWLRLSARLAARLAREARPPGRVAGALWGALSGFTSTVAHAGGPPVAIYLLAQRLDRSLFVGTSAVFFLMVNYVKLVPYHFLGQLNTANLGTALLFAPLAPLGIWLGVWIHGRLSAQRFGDISHAIVLVTGLKLIVDGI